MFGLALNRKSVFVWLFIVCIGLTSFKGYSQGIGKGNQQILDDCKDSSGLCVILGGDNADFTKLAVALAQPGKLLVHGIVSSDKALSEARNLISASNIDGFVSVEKLPLNPLPYRNNLVNIMIVPDLKVAEKAGYSAQEAMRALAPFGKRYVVNQGKLQITDKKVHPGMDEWTHNMHGPDGNRASEDTVVSYPFGFRWHGGLTFNINNRKRQGNRYSSTRGMAVANGRCFTFSDSVIENLGPAYFLGQNLDQYVTARDAFSGLFLWRKKIGNVYYGGLWHMNMAPFAAVGDYVYTVSENGKLLVIDAKNLPHGF